jgi:hypothetical protein
MRAKVGEVVVVPGAWPAFRTAQRAFHVLQRRTAGEAAALLRDATRLRAFVAHGDASRDGFIESMNDSNGSIADRCRYSRGTPDRRVRRLKRSTSP